MIKHKIFPIDEECLPKKQKQKDALYDLYARITTWPGTDYESKSDITIDPGETKIIPLGFKVICMPGYEFQVRPRSGLAKEGIQIGNSPGCVDENYRGEVGAIVYNSSKVSYTIYNGDRIAQGNFVKLSEDDYEVISLLEFLDHTSERGENGFGSSGR